MATTCVLTYYCTLIGLSLFYLGSSLYPTLPWTDCDDHVVIPLLVYDDLCLIIMIMIMYDDNDQVAIPKDKVCLPSKPVLEAKNLTRCCLVLHLISFFTLIYPGKTSLSAKDRAS